VEFDNIGHFAIGERLQAFTRLGIPDLDLPVIRCGDELGTLVVERDILDSLSVTDKCPQAVSLVINIP
jgi:hypothetical protein